MKNSYAFLSKLCVRKASILALSSLLISGTATLAMELPDPEDNKSVRRLPDINDVGHRLCAISEFKVKYDGHHMVYVVCKCKRKTGDYDTEEKLLDGESAFELSHYLLNWDVRRPIPAIDIIKLGDDKISFERSGGWGYPDIELTAQESADLLNAQLKAFKAFCLGNKNISIPVQLEDTLLII